MKMLLQWLVRAYKGILSRFRNLWYRALGVKITGYVWMQQVRMTHQIQGITLEGGVALDEGVVLEACGDASGEKLIIRKGTYINRHTIVNAHRQVDIGPGCMIGPFCYITDGNHGMDRGTPVQNQVMDIKPVIIEEGVWLGAHVTVLPGIRLGKGCVIGAGAVVNSDIPADAIAAGVPTRIIGYRKGASEPDKNDEVSP